MPFPDGDGCVDGPGCGPDAVTVGSRSRSDEAEMGQFLLWGVLCKYETIVSRNFCGADSSSLETGDFGK